MDAGASAGGWAGTSLQEVGEWKPNPPLSEFYPEMRGFETQHFGVGFTQTLQMSPGAMQEIAFQPRQVRKKAAAD